MRASIPSPISSLARMASGPVTVASAVKKSVPIEVRTFGTVEPNATVVAIDEAQFFDWKIAEVAHALADRGVRVIVAGLDMDFRGEPFGPMPLLMAQAETVDKFSAICVVCGEPASRTQRLINDAPANYDDPVILVGASEVYEARCRHCHQVPGREGAHS